MNFPNGNMNMSCAVKLMKLQIQQTSGNSWTRIVAEEGPRAGGAAGGSSWWNDFSLAVSQSSSLYSSHCKARGKDSQRNLMKFKVHSTRFDVSLHIMMSRVSALDENRCPCVPTASTLSIQVAAPSTLQNHDGL